MCSMGSISQPKLVVKLEGKIFTEILDWRVTRVPMIKLRL